MIKNLALPRLCGTIIASLALCCLFCSCTSSKNPDPKPPVESAPALIASASYEDVYTNLQETTEKNNAATTTFMGQRKGKDADILYRTESVSDADAKNTTSSVSTSAPTSSYSSTNVQIEGIDEGDIVKTDGSFIYSISNNRIYLCRAAGAETDVVNSFVITRDGALDTSPTEFNYEECFCPQDLFIWEDTLAVIYQDLGIYGDNDYLSPSYFSTRTTVAFVDIKDPTQPFIKSTHTQEGSLEASRLSQGTLVFVTSLLNYTDRLPLTFTPEEASFFIPTTYENATPRMVDPSCIFIAPECEDLSYTTASTLSMASGTSTSTVSLYGRYDTAFMDANTLYLAGSTYAQTESDPYQDSVYTVVDITEKALTRLASFSLVDGILTLQASTTFEGELLNQFSLDEYDNALRVATTKETYNLRILTDKSHDVESYQNSETKTNQLIIFDKDLTVKGSVNDLAAGEEIYSVRFDGPVGYVVTFKEVDPLFAIDLSDPTNPFVTSALKIPGFSRYLHLYTENRLFGLGKSVSLSEWGSVREDDIKLSMFDVTDPFDVTEKHTLTLADQRYSDALYDHHALFISPENDIIGIPLQNAYVIYGYRDDSGFYLRTTVADIPNDSSYAETMSSYYAGTRGLFIGDEVYIVGPAGITVLSLDTLEEIVALTFNASEE